MLQCTSSLLLSRLDTEQSSIFICQNYQMNSQRCGHAVALHAWAKSGLQQRGSAELAALTDSHVCAFKCVGKLTIELGASGVTSLRL